MSGMHKAPADPAYTMASEVIRTCISRFHGLWYALPLVYLAELLAAKPGHAVNRSLLRISQTRRRRTFPASSVDPRRANPYSI